MRIPKEVPLLLIATVALWSRVVPADCPLGDLTGDCVVNAADVAVFSGQWLASGAGSADFDANDLVNTADFAVLADNWRQAGANVVINELHVDPDVKTDLVEFVELCNAGAADVSLEGWRLDGGVFYTFPAGATLPAGGYLIVAQSPDHIRARWGAARFPPSSQQLFGPFAGKLSNEGERIALYDAAGDIVDEVSYQVGFPWPTVGDPVREPGTGRSMQLVNPRFDNDLGGSWRSGTPTPAAANDPVFAENLPPQVRQVKHSPKQPVSGEAVTVTAKVTDPDGIFIVSLMYQVVSPGSYITSQDSAYRTNWINVPMHDDGLDGDAVMQDDVYIAEIPASVQKHRTLVRYRIIVADKLGNNVLVPYSDDPQPNFAYFVYDGVPAWRGAARPGDTGPLGEVVEYSPEVLTRVPVYHLIARKSDVEACMWLDKVDWRAPEASNFKWYGTLVYDGEVYDHIRFRARGGVWRYAMGKNMWKFDFNRGHYFQARDDYGDPYRTKWNRLNFSACIQQGSFGQRGEQGMFEALSFRLFNLAGVPASKTNYVHFRVIDETHEDGTLNAAHPPPTSTGTQYDGDFWGLYMTIEQMDGRFLDEHDLPDGNLYKMDRDVPGGFEKNNQGPTAVTDNSDLQSFRSRYASYPSAQWWGENVNLHAYYGYYAIYQAIHHGDITEKNWFLYLNPELTTNEWGTNYLWWQLPWDLDLTWTTYYGSNDPSDPFSRAGLLDHEVLNIQNKNRLREVVDLLFNTDQTNQLIDEYAAVIDDSAGGPSMVDADRAMWDYHWVVGDGAYPTYLNQTASFKAGQGRFYQEAVNRGYQPSFEGMVQVMKDYVVERVSYLNGKAADAAIPNTPVVQATCPPGFPSNALTFHTSPFGDPQGAGTFAAMKWRIAEVSPGSQVISDEGGNVLLLPDGAMWRYFKGLSEPSATPGAWREPDFDDSAWLLGNTAIGFGESFLLTPLADMRGNYTTIYLRNTFDVANLSGLSRLILEVKYDDGVVVWINGQVAFQGNVTSTELPYNATAISAIEDDTFIGRDMGDPATWLVRGTNVIAVQVLNASLSGSSDCFIDVRLLAERAEGAPLDLVTPQIIHREPGRYEIEAAWESENLIVFNNDVQVPASVVKPGRTYRVRCRMEDDTGRWSHWSAPVQFVAGDPIAAGILADLRITEVMYNPPATADDAFTSDEYEFIELKNTGDETLDLSSVSFTSGIAFDFSGGAVTTLPAGRFVLIVRNKEAFLARYGSALSGIIAGQYTGKLANDGERVALEDYWNGPIAEFEYGDGRGWPVAADGAGPSLVPLDSALLDEPRGSLNYPGNWRASTFLNGSPGQDDPIPPRTVLLNEFLADPNAGAEWVELYNPTAEAVNLGDWYLSDDPEEPKKYALPAVSIDAHGHLAFADMDTFGLSRGGEDLVLSYLPGTAEDRIADAVSFKAQEPGVSLGRYPDGGAYWRRLEPSPGRANVNAIADIVIDEIMYHPPEPNDEYIELYNPTARAVTLATEAVGWRLDGAVDYDFPTSVLIPAGGRIVVVGFDPLREPSRLASFIFAYGGSLTAGVDLFGPWQGNLSNGGERLGLEKPQLTGDPADPEDWVLVDEVIYSDVSPWPPDTDGTGNALQRTHADETHSGNDPANWHAAPPSPGTAP